MKKAKQNPMETSTQRSSKAPRLVPVPKDTPLGVEIPLDLKLTLSRVIDKQFKLKQAVIWGLEQFIKDHSQQEYTAYMKRKMRSSGVDPEAV